MGPMVAAAIAAIIIHAQAYTPTKSSRGVQVAWAGGRADLKIVGNPVNSGGFPVESFREAVVRGLQRWASASGGTVGFDYWQGEEDSEYVPNSEYNGVSSFYFASHANAATRLDPSMIGLTQVWYNSESGEIIEVDTVLNDIQFEFTNDPKDTTGYGSSSRNYGSRRKVFVDGVVTHELGHSLGLSHSGALQSTMLFMEAPEQSHLGCDDQVGIRAIYPSNPENKGSISGLILSEAGKPVFGTHVAAISALRGAVVATGMSDASGKYSIEGLEPGEYVLMAEPFFAGISALPSYYSTAKSSICAGDSYARTFLLEPDAITLKRVAVAAGADTEAPGIPVTCTSTGGADVAGDANGATLHSGGGVFASLDRLDDSSGRIGEKSYRLASIGGKVKIRVLAYSLYSPVRATAALYDSTGKQVAESSVAYESADSGYVNYDAWIEVADLPSGDYELRLGATTLSSTLYPAGPLAIDSVPFAVITGSVDAGEPALAEELGTDPRCGAREEFADYASPESEPARSETDSTGACAIVDAGGSGAGPGPGAIAGFFLPFVAMLAGYRASRRQAFSTVR